ncbi:hypothetical protein AeMF1_010740 [Aphanomyces euteiches]|nr:hypothetical protein AeMF1_010740 [Aphanomyces euteiches]KAH9188656.1 hypothetical protein AeNC1_009371 [Aphanomyces euteiches]
MSFLWSLLPINVVLDATSFLCYNDIIAFVEALRPNVILEPLEHLYRLGLTHNSVKIWPSLCLEPTMLGSEYLSSYEAIAGYYGKVVLEDNWQDVTRLKMHLNPTAVIEWRSSNFSVPTWISDEWVVSRITGIEFSSETTRSSSWNDVLPRLPNLTYVLLEGGCDLALSSFTKFLATGNHKITVVYIFSINYELSTSEMAYLTKWFRHQPVQEFEFFGDVDDIDQDVQKAFYQAVFDCPTLEKLSLHNFDIQAIDISPWTFKMRYLELDNCLKDSEDVETFASRLQESNLSFLKLRNYWDENVYGIECLLRVLPLTPIKQLVLTGIFIESSSWLQLVPLFETCTLKTLTLRADTIPTDFAQSFARAMQNNHTICQLNLGINEFAIDDLRFLVECFYHPSRRVKSKRIKLGMPQIRSNDYTLTVESSMELAKSLGCDFDPN